MSKISIYQQLSSLTNDKSVIAELALYIQNSICPDSHFKGYRDLVDEPQVVTWEKYIAESKVRGIFETLKKYLVQFRFPIEANISQTTAYKNATLKGADTRYINTATGLTLKEPELLELFLYPSLAGKIPVLITNNRYDFQAIIRALSSRNEPRPMPDSMGAAIIQGLNNWDRLKTQLAQNSISKQDLLSNKFLYQDRIIVLSRIPYSNIGADKICLPANDWLNHSLKIRLEHECAHYFTLRYFGKMSNNMHDELIADYMGICSVLPHYRSDWFLTFIGLEDYPSFRTDGRLKNYLGKPPLSIPAFKILQTIIKKASDNLEIFDQTINKTREDTDRKLRMLSLCHLNLLDIAAEEGVQLLTTAYENLQIAV